MKWTFDFKVIKARTPQVKGDIVLLHGFAVDYGYFIFVIDKFPAYNLYFLNLPGHGQMKVSNNKKEMKMKLRFDYMASYVIQFLKEQNLTNIILIAHSMGGAVASIVENRARDRIKKLILISPMNYASMYTCLEFRRNFFPKTLDEKLKGMKVLYKKPRNGNNKLWMRMMDIQLKSQLKDWKQFKFLGLNEMATPAKLLKVAHAQKNIKVPLMVCLGQGDGIVPYQKSKTFFQKHHPDCKIVTFRDSGHLCFEEETFKFAKEVKDFLDAKPNSI